MSTTAMVMVVTIPLGATLPIITAMPTHESLKCVFRGYHGLLHSCNSSLVTKLIFVFPLFVLSKYKYI